MKATQADIERSETVLAMQLKNDDEIIFDNFIWIIKSIEKSEIDSTYYTITATRETVREIYMVTEEITFNAFQAHSFYRH